MNSKQNIQQIKIVYSLKIHTQLQLKGFDNDEVNEYGKQIEDLIDIFVNNSY